MHDAGCLRRKRRPSGFEDGQGVHVGTNADSRPITRTNTADYTSFAHTCAYIDTTDFTQRIGHQCGSAELLEAELGMRMDVAAQANQLVTQLLGACQHGHSTPLRVFM